MYTAQYLPMLEEGEQDPSKSGFFTEDEAWEYVFTQMCEECQKERAEALAGTEPREVEVQTAKGEKYKHEMAYSLHPACACEWIVGHTGAIDQAEDFGDLLAAGGYKKVWKKGDTKETI
jgi:hypothetical protein